VWSISINVERHQVFTPSHILADLRVVAETFFYPLKQIGFCSQENRRALCPHKLPPDDPRYVLYTETAVKDMKAILEVYFLHSNTYLYLR
jgi:hypothetical protein